MPSAPHSCGCVSMYAVYLGGSLVWSGSRKQVAVKEFERREQESRGRGLELPRLFDDTREITRADLQRDAWLKLLPWDWLKQTPTGSWGIIPGLGLRFYHVTPTAVQGRGIWVDNGDEWVTIRPTATSWTRPARLHLEARDRGAFRARCALHLAARA